MLSNAEQTNAIVLIKQVPEMDKVKFDVEKGRVDRSSAKGEINPFDLNAIEAAVQMKERIGSTVTVISMGPPQAEESLKDALARGADRAILLTDREFGGADTWATSFTLAAAIRRVGSYSFIFCGEKTVDGDTGQVGPEVAEHLNIPHVAYVCQIKEYTKEKLEVVSEIGRSHYFTEVKAPGLITVTKDVNAPRYISFRRKMEASRAKIEVWGLDELLEFAGENKFGIKGSPTRVFKIVVPKERVKETKIFDESLDEAVRRLADEIEKIFWGRS